MKFYDNDRKEFDSLWKAKCSSLINNMIGFFRKPKEESKKKEDIQHSKNNNNQMVIDQVNEIEENITDEINNEKTFESNDVKIAENSNSKSILEEHTKNDSISEESKEILQSPTDDKNESMHSDVSKTQVERRPTKIEINNEKLVLKDENGDVVDEAPIEKILSVPPIELK